MGFGDQFAGMYSAVAGAKRSKQLMSALRAGGRSKPASDPLYDASDSTDQESSLNDSLAKPMDEDE